MDVDKGTIKKIRKASIDLLEKNRRKAGSMQYTVPSSGTYPYQWLWDSCFHAIVLSKIDPEVAKGELRSLVSKQFDDGLIPHMIYWEPGKLHAYEWGKEGTSAITQPPMIALAVWEIYKQDDDISFLEEMYPALISYYTHLISRRDPRDRHLIGIINPDESGEDNSPRFDGPLGVESDINIEEHLKKRLTLVEANKVCKFDAERCMKDHFWVKDVPFNAILVENLHTLGHIASRLEKEEGEHLCQSHLDLISEAMRRYMFEDGVFWSTEGSEYEKIKVSTWAIFAPLFAGLYSKEEADVLVKEHLLNSETFWSPLGIRSVSAKEESYNPEGMWRGPIWIAIHWFVYKGLMRYGFESEAEEICQKSIRLLDKEGFREYFNPETGGGLGAEDFTWGTLVLDMLE